MKSPRYLSAFLIACLIFAAGAPTVGASDQLVIATGGTGGVYYPYGEALAGILSDALDDTQVTVSVTAASVDNMQLIDSGDADIAFVLGDTAFDAVAGNAPFEAPIPGRALATLYNNFTQIVASGDSGIASVADLAGKRVSVGAAGSGTEIIANRILAAAGIDPETGIEHSQLGVDESATALADGTIDAFFFSGGLPTPAITNLGSAGDSAFSLIPSGDITASLQATYGAIYSTATIPADTYPGQAAAIDVVVVPNVLVVNASMDADVAYAILTAIFSNADALAADQPAAADLSPASAAQNSPIPYHEGALRYYQEHNIPVATPVK